MRLSDILYDLSSFHGIAENVDLNLHEDYSDFVVVDGEEADYGTIQYYDEDGLTVCVKVVQAGDVEYLEYTEHGKQWLYSHLCSNMWETLKEAPSCDYS